MDWRGLRYSQNVEDRRGESAEDSIGNLLDNIDSAGWLEQFAQRQDEEARMRQQHVMHGQNTPITPLGMQLGVHEIENSPVAQRWIDRNQPAAPQRFMDAPELPNKNWFGTQPEQPDIGKALQALQLNVNPDQHRVEGKLPLPVPGLGLEGSASSPVDWRLMMKLRGQF